LTPLGGSTHANGTESLRKRRPKGQETDYILIL